MFRHLQRFDQCGLCGTVNAGAGDSHVAQRLQAACQVVPLLNWATCPFLCGELSAAMRPYIAKQPTHAALSPA
jgi:hypothetical protein